MLYICDIEFASFSDTKALSTAKAFGYDECQTPYERIQQGKGAK